MSSCVYIKVVGFKDVERHALNTVFKLSAGRPVAYGLWSPELQRAPHLLLVDLEANQSGLALVAPDLDAQQKMICVGQGAPAHAWRTFARPLHWPDVVAAMDSLFAVAEKLDDGIDFGNFDQTIRMSQGFKIVLLADPQREDRMYLRARLALAGHTHVDDAETAAQALELARQRHYDLVVVALNLPDMDGWQLVKQLVKLEPAIGHVVVATPNIALQGRERAEYLGCFGLLEKPFKPSKVVELLQKI